jgi:hypothetical protein
MVPKTGSIRRINHPGIVGLLSVPAIGRFHHLHDSPGDLSSPRHTAGPMGSEYRFSLHIQLRNLFFIRETSPRKTSSRPLGLVGGRAPQNW